MVNGRFKGLKSELRSGPETGEPAMRVLLIEDEPTTAKSIELMLGSEGFNVYTTDLGGEGLDLGKLYDYDIILLDVNLPDMDGYDVTKEMFLSHRYGGIDEPELKIIDVFICKLRKKLSLACGGANYIETVWGRGYVLRDPEEVSEPEPQVAVA